MSGAQRSCGSPAVPAPVARRAVQWWVELGSGHATDATRARLARWRAEDPAHDAAWRHIESVNGRLGRVADALSAQAARAALLPPRSRERRAAVKALAVLLFAGGAAWMADVDAPWRAWGADVRTAIGERRTITLADGTTVVLNTASAIDVRFDDATRRVRLLRGEIMVTSGDDAARAVARPLVIATAHGDVRPVGTRFSVRERGDATRVDVFEGAVRIAPLRAAGDAPWVTAGHGADFTRDALAGPPRAIGGGAGAWADGILVASNLRLADLLAEIDRYRAGRVRCDAAVANLRVSGTYPLDDTDRILDTLRETLPVDVEYVTRYWVTVVAARE
ncbi:MULTISPECIES: FecR domain-containing protein [Burkholderia]|uniref:FecR domain-containing protein n=1 Tax=Burkholderia TaxID=32008 RepID=UPI00053134D2|nr:MULTISPECIES: FecR domain-containing protein [Burkholderia]AOJ71624.1 iron dicitrate transport regulator FecR [Burkholderia savannae]KGS03424.1 fecR family protein [Burkholderia sp. ABCPW 111]KVG47649.1 iron dicitrate transport regulator FecR [Burkholderia sp. MSMB0265]KVG80535.1 iron dicitrate transport regulator FecR [Burkholderia sp. MSMB2040]KVG93957.1 iron dicitrate transport regulator FecR [Burkholderia sp. MSMB2042]